jgi:hypothetical protein
MIMTNHNNTIAISTEKGSFNPLATEESKGLVKKLYYAMKHKNLFYRFQRSFFPLSGLDPSNERHARTHHFYPGESVKFGDINYRPVTSALYAQTIVPKLIVELNMIKRMLRKRFDPIFKEYELYEGYNRIFPMSEAEALGYYTDYYFTSYKQTKKVKPTGLMFEFLFGTFGLILFTTALFMCISLVISSAFAIAFGLFIILITSIILLGIIMN